MQKILHVSMSVVRRNPRVLNAIKASAECGYEVDCVSLKDCIETFKAGGGNIRYYFCPVCFGTGVFELLRYLFFFIRCFFFICSRRNLYDAVFVHTMPDFLVFSALAAKYSGKKIILDFSDMFPEVFSERRFGNLFFRPFILVEKLSALFSDKIFCVHRVHKELLEKRSVPKQRVQFVLNIPDPKIFLRHKKHFRVKEGFTIFYAGSASKRFGLDLALKAFYVVSEKIPDVKFVILTGGRGSKRIKREIEKSFYRKNIIFRGSFEDHERAVESLMSADLALAPYRKTQFTDMVDSLKVLEYAGAEVPFVCSDLKRLRHYFSESECYFSKAGDYKSLAQKIIDALENYPESQKKAQRAKSALEKYSFYKQMDKYKTYLISIRH
ncbi:glycosyltransferase [candidate division WOR-3 bacterium]|nr:glycosyltransferase [candidate division WOR-3 bacterium]